MSSRNLSSKARVLRGNEARARINQTNMNIPKHHRLESFLNHFAGRVKVLRVEVCASQYDCAREKWKITSVIQP